MVETIRLAPHDPVPDYGNHALLLRRMGEDDPNAVITEMVFYGHDPQTSPLSGGSLDAAIKLAETEAARRGLATLYVVDRTAGRLEKEAIAEHGRSFPTEKLQDTDPEDGETGSDIRDRPHDAGFVR